MTPAEKPGEDAMKPDCGPELGKLASYAVPSFPNRGRFVREDEGGIPSTPFSRDRDRIIRAVAFRRLKHKTQVFVSHQGDHYRTRLTHTLEVAHIARVMARALRVNEELAEVLALAHDLGHTPFGHAGERTLNDCMAPYGGFDHNTQALRIVTRLERRHAEFDGLNLTFDTLEGLAKHNGPLPDAADKTARGDARLLRRVKAVFADAPEVIRALRLDHYPPLEAQLAVLADDIAYNAHDIDDGLRAGLFELIDLGDIPLVGGILSRILATWPRLETPRVIHEMMRRIVSTMIHDVVEQTSMRLARHSPQSCEDIRRLDAPLADFSPQLSQDSQALQRFLTERMYRHSRVSEMMQRACRVTKDLFGAYMGDPALLPGVWKNSRQPAPEDDLPRRVCDFIAGMTDVYALKQHKRLFDLDILLV